MSVHCAATLWMPASDRIFQDGFSAEGPCQRWFTERGNVAAKQSGCRCCGRQSQLCCKYTRRVKCQEGGSLGLSRVDRRWGAVFRRGEPAAGGVVDIQRYAASTQDGCSVRRVDHWI